MISAPSGCLVGIFSIDGASLLGLITGKDVDNAIVLDSRRPKYFVSDVSPTIMKLILSNIL